MILPSFIIIDSNKYDDLPEVAMPEGAYIGYKITSTSVLTIGAFYKKLFLSTKKYPFCLVIDLPKEPDAGFESIVDFLVSFTFHSNYIKTESDDPLVLFNVDQTNSHKYIAAISQAFKSHGYNDIKAMVIGEVNGSLSEYDNKNIRFDLQKDFDSLPAKYVDAIKKVSSSHFFFSFFLEYPKELPGFLSVMEETELIIRRDFPQVYCLLTENRSFEMKEHKLMSRLELLQEQLSSLNNYHLNYNSTFVKYKKQIGELLKFYKNEYEILPTWYKRFGHIIKVLMGKRSFRSLFNDNVKKYND